MSALISFLGGSAFRLIWAAFAEWMEKRQEHAQETERMRLQAGLDRARHVQDCERLRLQSELGVKEIMVKADADIGRAEADAFVAAIKAANKPTGIAWVDAWNGMIRPLTASVALTLWLCAMATAGWTMSEWDKELIAVAIGFYFANRELSRGRK